MTAHEAIENELPENEAELPKNDSVPHFIERAYHSIESASSYVRLSETRQKRIMRKFSIKDICDFLDVSRRHIYEVLEEHPDAPEGEISGRERVFTLDDMMLLRLLLATRRNRKPLPTMHWRPDGEKIPVIVVSSQKGGSGKSLTSANIAQYLSLHYGARVGLIDGDAQATLSLYFASDDNPVALVDTPTFTNFMGVTVAKEPPIFYSGEELDQFWTATPWPGIRLIPGGPMIQESEIAMHYLASGEDRRFRKIHRLLRDAIARWEEAHPAKTRPEDLIDEDGRVKWDEYEAALNETLDVIVIDCAPSLSMAVLNAIVAADTLIIPQPMKGFDLSTATVFLGSALAYMEVVHDTDPDVSFSTRSSMVLPTIVSQQSNTDLKITGELYNHDPEIICPIFYSRSEAVANASELYQSIYEYVPPKSRRQSAAQFIENANAVNDAITSRAVPWMPTRGFANAFLERVFGPGVIPPWTTEEN